MDKSYHRRKWSIWGILVLAFVAVFFHRLAMGVVADDLIRDLSLTGKTLGNLTSMNFYAYALMQIPVGIMVDTIGVRKICSWGTLLTGIGSIMFGLANSLLVAYIARFLVGIGTSVIIISILKVQSIWFKPEKYSTLSGYTSFFGNFGAFLATVPLAYVVLNIGWRNSFLLMGITSVIISIAIWFIVRDHPSELGYDVLIKPKGNKNIWKGLKEVITNPYTWPPFAIMFFMVGSTTAIIGLWGMPYLMHVYHISKTQAAGYLSFVSIGFIIGAPIVGKVSDYLRGEIKRILSFATIIYLSIWGYMAFMGGQPPLHQIPFIFLLIGFSTICHILAFTNVKEVNDENFAGSAAAIINVGEFVGGSLLSLGMGVILDLGWQGTTVDGASVYSANQYQMVFIIMAVMALVSFLATLAMKGKTTRRNDLNGEQVAL
ncbi:MFS transporter [Alkaliphilus transvaalensis]|uniref:MFS transporter n=1 Tax=Alkaliphilus transvaalensis TaxID=114628 RepID=UPI000686D615|nr:MFS transporter [Alkaliphilus transvaalensis]